MNTYETMKHNIPEGATHYSDESDVWHFSWFKKEGDKWFIQIWSDNGNWVACEHDEHIKSEVKPIPTEAPEPTKTYRYEKVTDSIFDLKEEFERGELYFAWVGNSVGYEKITDEKMLLCRYEEKRILRRIEVTERELFIDAYASAFNTHMLLVEDVAGTLFDSGKFKLVNGKG